MAELFKNIYNEQFFEKLTNACAAVYPSFDTSSFLSKIYSDNWEQKELKERMRWITIALKEHLHEDFKRNSEILIGVVDWLESQGIREGSIEFMFIPDFVEVYGLDQYEVAIPAIERITQFTSCEFGIRPFIIKYPDKCIPQMLQWAKHPHPMVRRLATEGCRPRLPWAMAIPALKKDPSPILPILEMLKTDEAETVRRSVANNLNDISKDNPEIATQLAKKWIGISKETDWVVKHGCRTMLKQARPEVLELFGYSSVEKLEVESFQITTPKVKIGDALNFTFNLINKSASPAKIRLEYGLYYQKANGSLSKKVFKISEKEYAGNSNTAINRKQSFRIITTRKYHLGLHQVSIIINGKEFGKKDFELIE